MLKEPVKIGVAVGLFVVFCFLLLHFRRKIPPKLNQVFVLLLACVGGTVGFDFGYTVKNADSKYLGNLNEQRLIMVIGAVAVVWVALESMVEIFLRAIKIPENDD